MISMPECFTAFDHVTEYHLTKEMESVIIVLIYVPK